MKTGLLLTSHSNKLAKFYENAKYCDISITVGDIRNTERTFIAHSSILVAQSEYFAVALSDEWVRRESNKLIVFKKPNIEPRIFEILLRYMYSGKIDLSDHGVPTLLDLLVAADELILEDLIEYIQECLLEQYSESMVENFAMVNQVAFQHSSFVKLQEYCTEIVCKNPAAVFQSSDFVEIQETALISLLRRDDLNLKEIEIWEKVLEWGIAQVSASNNVDLSIPVDQWSQTEFNELKATLKNCLPLIRFFHINSVDFYNKVISYSELLPKKLYKDLLHHYLVPGSEEQQASLHLIRNSNNSISTILSHGQINKMIQWINERDSEKKYPFDFNLLLRGSRDGFTPSDFHRLCDNKGSTIVAVRVKNSDKIIGGYNPIEWESLDVQKDYPGLMNSFLFKFDSDDIIGSNGILSKYNDKSKSSVSNRKNLGPCFGHGFDLSLGYTAGNYCCKRSFEFGLLSESTNVVDFDIDDYEVFQIVKK